jgi:hypothetical protein
MAMAVPTSAVNRRARAAMTVVEVLHYLMAVLAFLPGGVLLLSGLFDLLNRLGQGLVVWRDVDKCLTALVFIVYGAFTVRSASMMGRLRRREFSVYWAWAHAVTIAALPLALVTWLVLSRRSVKELYASRIMPFEPLVLPPPLPMPVIPLHACEAENPDVAPAGGARVA